MPNSGRDIDIFEYCQYVIGTFEFHKLLNMNWFYLLLVVTMEQSKAFCRMEMKLFVFNSG